MRCLIDEAANIGQIPNLERLMATIRSREISACLVLQAQSQLKALYKDNMDTIIALNECTDSKLYIAMNLAFACSLRMGEILGLTWKTVHIEDSDIASDNAYIYIEAELTRVSKRAMEALGERDIYHIFKPLMPNTTTRLVLKKPKTETSIRKIWLPKTVAYILRDWRQAQNELKGFLGDEYQDFDLVVALPNGRPCEGRLIEKEFGLLKESAKLPNVDFHSLRHSGTTYKLKLNHGDLKATQGDTGHAEIDVITKVYAHILDEDRKINAQKFETAFYSNPDLRQSKPQQEQSAAPSVDINALIEQLKTLRNWQIHWLLCFQERKRPFLSISNELAKRDFY